MSIQRIHSLPFLKETAVAQVKGRPQEITGGLVFRQLLDRAASETPDGRAGAWLPLSKQELAEILNAVRARMNARLMHAMSAEIREGAGLCLPFTPDRILPLNRETSGPSPEKQNHDVQNRPNDLESVIHAAATAHGVDPDLIKSVIKIESNFNPNSTSPKGAMGLMQLMPGTAREFGVQNSYDPVENIRAGTRYLSMLLKRYGGNVTMALAAYNWGMGNLERRPAQMPSETRMYIENVTRRYEQAKA